MFKPNFLFILAIIFLIGLDNARSSPLKKNTPASPEDKTAAAADLDDESAYDDEEETKATADDKNNSTTATADIKKETTAATTVQSARTTATVDETVSKSNTADPSTSTVMHLFPHKATASTNTKLSESDEDYQYKDLPEKSKPKTVMKNPILSDEGEEAAPPAGDAAEAGAAGADGAAAAGAEGAAGAAAGNGTAGAAGDGGGGGGAAGGKDVTPSGPPKFFRDHMGNWVYNLWGATLGKVGQDSRYPEMRTIEHFKIDSNAAKKYYPECV
ncbi:glycine-rich protein 1 isoform X2 [Drosophila virilis]|uniref:glycine-rich protein 1 isoform X2 n=1 Tax=Drosophila virilis TaxID=7244 RepID=UPI0013961E90|nr:circumsporozoite protein isoform X2 [Drosophila virilis]